MRLSRSARIRWVGHGEGVLATDWQGTDHSGQPGTLFAVVHTNPGGNPDHCLAQQSQGANEEQGRGEGEERCTSSNEAAWHEGPLLPTAPSARSQFLAGVKRWAQGRGRGEGNVS